MRLIIRPTYEDISKWAANHVAQKLKNFLQQEKSHFILGLPTGSSPIGMYKNLIKLNKDEKISFQNVITFNMDEYIGIEKNHPESYHSFMWKNFFSHIDIKKENINILNGNASNLKKECEEYEKKIKSFGGIMLFVGGIGPDGHIAFNEPGSSLTSRTRIKTLTQDTIIANSRFFEGNVNKVPKSALTVGVGTIMDSEEILIIVNGHNKARALKHAIEKGINHMWTISALQLHKNAIIVSDKKATYELKVGTVEYFNDIERENFNNDLK